MDKSEIALQLTVAALKNDKISLNEQKSPKKEAEQNSFNAKQISDFYKSILAELP
jgi:hypothetical protein